MPKRSDVTPAEIIAFWFPDGENPKLEPHMELWAWRMRGGANEEIMANYTDATHRAADGEFDDWANDPLGRLALIILLDQFPRTVWAGDAKAYAQDPKALSLCLEGLENGHFDALPNVWYKSVFKLPMEHCECPDHVANLDRVIQIADQILEDAPDNLKNAYAFAAQQPRKHRAVIAQFGRHCHRNEILRRPSTPDELAYLAEGVFPHETDLNDVLK